MQTHVYNSCLHAEVAKHLSGEFSTAAIKLQDGQELILIKVGNFVQGGSIAGEVFGAEPCTFDPAIVCDVTLHVLDPRMMGPSELLDMGLVSDPAEQPKKRTRTRSKKKSARARALANDSALAEAH